MDGKGSEPDMVTRVVPRIRPELRHLLWRYRIPAAVIVEVLERALIAADETWETGADKEDWLLVAVELECSAYWRGRCRRPPAARLRKGTWTGCRRNVLTAEGGRTIPRGQERGVLRGVR